MTEMTNAKRAECACEQIRGYSGDNDEWTDATDIVCDLLHYLRRAHALDRDDRIAWLMARVEMNDLEIAKDTEE